MEGKYVTTDSTWFLNLTTITTTQDYDNFLYGFPGEHSLYSTSQAIILALLLGIIVIGTVIGNILVCIAVCLVRKLRRPCNYLLVSLAVSDLCVALLVMPLAVIYEILGSWPLGSFMCDIWVSFDVLSCAASILNLCAISVDRYKAITKPLEYGVKRTPRRMIGWVALVWCMAGCISLAPLLILGNEYKTSETGRIDCSVCQNSWYQFYATMCSFYIPTTVMIYVYYMIFRAARKIVLEERRAQSHLEAHCHLDIEPPQNLSVPVITRPNNSDGQTTHTSSPLKQHRSSSASTTCSGHEVKCFTGGPRKSNESQCPMLQKSEKLTSSSSTTTTPLSVGKTMNNRNHQNSTCSVTNSPHQKKLRFQLAKERKASTTLGIIMSAFIICWLPFFVLALVRPFLKDPQSIPTPVSSVFLWLGYCNSLLNPIIYATLNRDFRKPFREILFFRCGKLNHMMREEFYHSQYGDPVNKYIRSGDEIGGHRGDNDCVEAIDVAPNTPNESFL